MPEPNFPTVHNKDARDFLTHAKAYLMLAELHFDRADQQQHAAATAGQLERLDVILEKVTR